MPYQNINASLSETDVQAAKDAFSTVLQKLPFLVNLSPDERKSIFKTGPGLHIRARQGYYKKG